MGSETYLDDANIRFLASVINRDFGDAFNPILDRGCDMGNNLGNLSTDREGVELDYLPGQSFPSSLHVAIARKHAFNTRLRIGKIAPHLLLDNLTINLACRDIVIARQRDVQISLIVSEVEIDFSTVVQDVDLACTPESVDNSQNIFGSTSPCSWGLIVPASIFM